MRLERGATGFWQQGDPELPVVDVRRFRGACHEAARVADGAVERVTERRHPRSFHEAVLVAGAQRYVVRCHGVHPLIAFDPDQAIDPPGWGEVFIGFGFEVLGREVLGLPLDRVDTSRLGPAEWEQIRYWQAQTVGETLFHTWD
ncbi:hypothetical protein GCM10010168_82470 [Actinoplanes ianthinogenes]|uniref:hypothetical protein n=1 Tax=Actinoplanes ianthinogenes TaxID=122358 RepID=UPI00166FDBCA|nr:hypothetical protein [Actinoplanes ianthinogenes]GGR51201.1 hypothetical protein GCM10010168_82470 [Actinoplanes ianthinogenes]